MCLHPRKRGQKQLRAKESPSRKPGSGLASYHGFLVPKGFVCGVCVCFACGGQKTTCSNQFSPSTELRASGLVANIF